MENGVVKSMVWSLLTAYVLSGVLLALLAFGLYRLQLQEDQVNTMVFVIYFASCLFGGITAGKGIRQRRFFWGLLSGLAYFLVLFVLSWFMNQGTSVDMERSLRVLGVCAAGGMAGGMIS